jgi:hypothetical protein
MSDIRRAGGWVVLVVVVMGSSAWGAEAMKLTLTPHKEARRWVVAEYLGPVGEVKPPFILKDEAGQRVGIRIEPGPGGEGFRIQWVVPEVPANAARSYVLESLPPEWRGKPLPPPAVIVKEKETGVLSVTAGGREVARYHVGGAMFEKVKHKKPFVYPLVAHGVNVLRGYPMEERPNEAKDHVHHTGVYFTHGEVNGRDYWSKLSVTPVRVVRKDPGEAFALIVAESAWGEDLNETQEVRVLSAGQDVVMDWTITLKAAGEKPVHLGKTKEGSFGVRVATGLTAPDPGKKPRAGDPRGEGKMVDALGNSGEEGIRPEKRAKGKEAAAWADNYGMVEGKMVGVAIMNHPSGWRFPGDWHVRHYGLFAHNPFMTQGEHHLKAGEPVVLKYRLYVHGGDAAAGKVAEVYAGYAHGEVKAE